MSVAAIEIVSADSVQRDRGEKFLEYEDGGIPEYWLIDAEREEALFYQRGQDGRFHPAPLDRDGSYHSAALSGFRLRVAWLWRQPLPAVSEVGSQTGL
jgi:Uma2 family endonuclease